MKPYSQRVFKHCLICLNKIDLPSIRKPCAEGDGGTTEGLGATDGLGGGGVVSREKIKRKRGRPPKKHYHPNLDAAGEQIPPTTFQATNQEGSKRICSGDLVMAESCSPGQHLESASSSEVFESPQDNIQSKAEGGTHGMERMGGSKPAPVIVRRGRGRPPKKLGWQGVMKVVKVTSGLKRGRGRPPKNVGSQGAVMVMKMTSGMKRGRGRPPKRPPNLELTSGKINFSDLADVPIQSTIVETSSPPCHKMTKDNSLLYLRLLWLAKRFLNIPTTRFVGAHAKMKKSMSIPFCHECVEYVEKLYEVYMEWENVNMRLTWRLTQIRESILRQFQPTNSASGESFSGSERRLRRVSNQLNLGSTQAVNRFRKLLALRCAEKIKRFGALPQVLLDRNSMKHKWSIPFEHMLNYMKSLIIIFVLAAKKTEEHSVGDVQDPVTDNMDANLKEITAGVVAVKSEVNPIECKLERDPDNWELTLDNDDDIFFEAALNSSPPHSPMELHEESSEDSAKHDNGKEANLEVEPPTATLTRSFNFRKRTKSINYEEEGLNNDNSDSEIPNSSEPTDAHVTPATDLADATRISEKKFACNICKKSFNSGTRLKAHLSRSHFLLPFKCEQCHQRCRTNQQLVIHRTKMHYVQTTTTTSQAASNKPSKCGICQEVFQTKIQMKEHRNQSHRGKEITCDICGACLKGVSRFTQHMKKHKTPKPVRYACEKCPRTQKTAKGLKLHMKLHEKNPDWIPTPIQYGKLRPKKNTPLPFHIICEFSGCDKRFCSMAGYEVHLILHKDSFSCTKCTETFPNYKKIFKHLVRTHELEEEQFFPCTHCHKSFTLEQTYDLHQKIHHPYLYKLRCDSEFCQETFDTLEELREHVKAQHLPPDATETVEDLEEALQFFRPSSSTSQDTTAEPVAHASKSETGGLGLFTCKRCKRSFPTRVALILHLFVHSKSDKSKVKCAICSKNFDRLAHLQKHFLKIHAKHIMYCLWCPICRIIAKRNHMKIHNLPKNQYNIAYRHKEGKKIAIQDRKPKQKIICNECPDQLEFVTYSKLYLHREECHGLQKTVKCTVDGCGQMFFTPGSLRSHMREHEKKFHCHLCPRRCSTNARLVQHLKVHAQEKNHACQFCGKMFVAMSGLKIHLDIHMGIKNYKCSYCDKAFCQKFALVCHERTHTKEKPFLCKFCGKGFGTQSVLRTHEKIHEKLGSSVILRRPFRKTIAGGSADDMWSTKETPPPDQSESLQAGTSSGSGTMVESNLVGILK